MNTIRSVKIPHNTVLFDYASTIIGSIIISYYTKIPLVIVTVCMFVLGEILHYIFNVKTNTLRYLKLM